MISSINSSSSSSGITIVGVVGLGYVGLPFAVEKGKVGFSVIGFDIDWPQDFVLAVMMLESGLTTI